MDALMMKPSASNFMLILIVLNCSQWKKMVKSLLSASR